MIFGMTVYGQLTVKEIIDAEDDWHMTFLGHQLWSVWKERRGSMGVALVDELGVIMVSSPLDKSEFTSLKRWRLFKKFVEETKSASNHDLTYLNGKGFYKWLNKRKQK